MKDNPILNYQLSILIKNILDLNIMIMYNVNTVIEKE